MFFALSCVLILFIGYARAYLELPSQQKNHYAQTEINKPEFVKFEGEVADILKHNAYFDKYYLDITKLKSDTTQGRLLLKIKNDSLKNHFQIGDKIQGVGSLRKIDTPQNPQRFDYAKFMRYQSVYASLNTEYDYIRKDEAKLTLKSRAEQVRLLIKEKLNAAGFEGEPLNLIEAMLLGKRDNISSETLSHFQDSGVIHVLAISGLHVGIILLFLHWITHFTIYNKYTRFLRPFIIISGLWCFAFIAGLSPSVVRASLMFSILSFSYFIERRTSPVNILCLALLIMLIYQPQYLFQVGFQLSFTAVLGILILQPKLIKLYQPRFFIDKIVWDVLSVSFIAQLSVLPLLLYYFNQASALFWLANLLIVPFLGIILGFGVMSIVMSLLGISFGAFVDAYSYILETLLDIIKWFAIQDHFIFKNIYFTESMLWASLLLLTSILLWSNISKRRSYIIFNLSLVVFIVIFITEYKSFKSQSDVYILKSYNQSLIAQTSGSEMMVYGDTLNNDLLNNYAVKSLAQLKGIQKVHKQALKNIYRVIESKNLLVIDSLNAYEQNLKYDYILLRNSPKINLERFIIEAKPQLIIADASNYKSYINRWKSTCKKYNIDFHTIYEMGYLNLKELKK